MDLKIYADGAFDALDTIQTLEIDESNADLPSGLPGWSVKDVIAHLVHLEEALVTGEDIVTKGGSNLGSDYTELGVEAYRKYSVGELLERLTDLGVKRREQVARQLAKDTLDPKRIVNSLGWDYETLLRNRAFDSWVHEQDLRKVLGLPFRFKAIGATISFNMFAASLPMVVGKRAKVPAGHAVRFVVTGDFELDRTFAVDENGRAGASEAQADTTISMTEAEFFQLMAGRAEPQELSVKVNGDEEIAGRVLASMNIVP